MITKQPKAPYELWSRADDTNVENPTLEWFEEEAKHVIDLIGEDGSGSWYEADPKEAKKISRECKAFLTRVKKYRIACKG